MYVNFCAFIDLLEKGIQTWTQVQTWYFVEITDHSHQHDILVANTNHSFYDKNLQRSGSVYRIKEQDDNRKTEHLRSTSKIAGLGGRLRQKSSGNKRYVLCVKIVNWTYEMRPKIPDLARKICVLSIWKMFHCNYFPCKYFGLSGKLCSCVPDCRVTSAALLLQRPSWPTEVRL